MFMPEIRIRLLALALPLPILCTTGCGGGGTGIVKTPPPAIHTAYVIQISGSTTSLLEFNASANGSVAPSGTLVPPANLALNRATTDNLGNIYLQGVVTGVAHTGEIAVYPPGSTGSATPARVLTGPLTLLTSPLSMAVDATGQMYITDNDDNAVLIFAPGATGNVAPVRQIANTGGFGIAVDTGGNVYVAPFPGDQGVVVYGPTASGNATPIRTISGTATTLGVILQIAVDSNANLYVANAGNASIDVFAPGANGNVAPTRVIAGSATTLANAMGVAVDSTGAIYVCDVADTGMDTGPSVDVFAPGANGNAAPQSRFTSTQWTQTDDASFALY
jgi:hypothetical protein